MTAARWRREVGGGGGEPFHRHPPRWLRSTRVLQFLGELFWRVAHRWHSGLPEDLDELFNGEVGQLRGLGQRRLTGFVKVESHGPVDPKGEQALSVKGPSHGSLLPSCVYKRSTMGPPDTACPRSSL